MCSPKSTASRSHRRGEGPGQGTLGSRHGGFLRVSHIVNEQGTHLGWGPGAVRNQGPPGEGGGSSGETGVAHPETPSLRPDGRLRLERPTHPPISSIQSPSQPTLTQPLNNRHPGAPWDAPGRRMRTEKPRASGGQEPKAGPRPVHFVPPAGCHSPFPFCWKNPSGSVTWADASFLWASVSPLAR